MTTTLNLPDDLASAVKQRAARGGHDVAAEVVELVRKGLAVSERAGDASPIPPTITTDPDTGLPLIQGAPDAPITRMTAEQVQALIDQAQEHEDLERAGGVEPVRKHLPLIKARPAVPGDAKSLTAQQMCDFIKDVEQRHEIERYERAFGHQHVDRARP